MEFPPAPDHLFNLFLLREQGEGWMRTRVRPNLDELMASELLELRCAHRNSDGFGCLPGPVLESVEERTPSQVRQHPQESDEVEVGHLSSRSRLLHVFPVVFLSEFVRWEVPTALPSIEVDVDVGSRCSKHEPVELVPEELPGCAGGRSRHEHCGGCPMPLKHGKGDLHIVRIPVIEGDRHGSCAKLASVYQLDELL